MRLLALSLVVTLLACGGTSKPVTAPPTPPDPVVTAPAEPTPTPTPSDAELEVLFGHSLDFFDELAVVLEANAADCTALAPELDRVFTKNQATLDEAKSYKGNPVVDAKADAYMELHKDRLQAATKKMMGGLQACGDDAAVQKVMNRFGDL